MRTQPNVVLLGIAVVSTCAALAFGYAWWAERWGGEAGGVSKENTETGLRRQMANMRFDMEALERQRVELEQQIEGLPTPVDLELQGEEVKERLRDLPTARELRREAVGIKPDGSHTRTGEIPPTVLNRMNEELGLSPQELRELQGQ